MTLDEALEYIPKAKSNLDKYVLCVFGQVRAWRGEAGMIGLVSGFGLGGRPHRAGDEFSLEAFCFLTQFQSMCHERVDFGTVVFRM